MRLIDKIVKFLVSFFKYQVFGFTRRSVGSTSNGGNMMDIYLVRYDGESLEYRRFSSLKTAKGRLELEWKELSSHEGASKLYKSDNMIAGTVNGQSYLWQMIPVEDGECALIEADWPWQELSVYYGSKKEVSDLMQEFYSAELDNLEDEDSRNESFCTDCAATVYHYGSEPASCWIIL